MKILHFSKLVLVFAEPTIYSRLNKIFSRVMKNTFFLEHVAPTYSLTIIRNNNS